MLAVKTQRGFLLIVAVILIAVAATMAAVIVTLTTGSGQAGGLHVSSTQALYAAEAGIEHSIRLFKNGTSCANLAVTVGTQTVGNASYTVTGTTNNPASVKLIAAGVPDGVTTTIQANSAIGGFASHGLIRIDSELILYSNISGNNFVGVTRGFGGTTAVAHAGGAAGADVVQNQCMVRATGTAGAATRFVESAIQLGPWAAFYDLARGSAGDSNLFLSNAAQTNMGTVTAPGPGGENIVIAAVTLQSNATATTINAGNLRLVRNLGFVTQTTVDTNPKTVRVGTNSMDANNRPQKTFFFVFRDAGRPSGDTYSVTAQAGVAGAVTYEMKMLVLNNVPVSLLATGNNGDAALPAALTTIATTGVTTLAAGDNVVIARVQVDNQAAGGGDTNIAGGTPGNLRLTRTAPAAATLTSNRWPLYYRDGTQTTQEYSHLLVALDANAPANPTYVVQAQPANASAVRLDADILIIKGVGAAFAQGNGTGESSASELPLVTLTAVTLPITNPGSSNVIVAGTFHDYPLVAAGAAVTLIESIVYNAVDRASSSYQYNLSRIALYSQHFSAAQLWLQPDPVPSGPTFSLNAQATAFDNANIRWQANVLGMHFHPVADREEIFP